MEKTDPAQRCLDLLKELRLELEKSEQFEDLRAEIDTLIDEIEVELKSFQSDKSYSEKLKTLLILAATTIRLILNLP